jgi:hypothetical protein
VFSLAVNRQLQVVVDDPPESQGHFQRLAMNFDSVVLVVNEKEAA